jgi:tetratricopeptide (TPR) repeat protein
MEKVRQVLAEEAVAPARLQPAVPRDLETICLKCLEKDPTRRYARADLLADDLRRVQEGRPILARPVGRLERAWRWARRNPRVAGLLSALVLVFLLGFLGILWQWRKAEALKVVAQQQRDEARHSLRELTSLVHFIDNDQLYYLNYVKLRKEAWEALATQAQEFLEQHADDRERAVDVARAHYRLAYFRQRSAGPAPALPHARRALELQKALVDRSPTAVPLQRDLAAVYLLVGFLLHADKHSDEALAYLRPCLELRRQILAADPNNLDFHSELAGSLNNLGLALNMLGKAGPPALLEEAAALQREAIEHSETACAKSPGVARYKLLLSHHHFNLAVVYCDLQRPAAAAEAVARCQELWPRDPEQSLRAARILSRATECKGKEALSPAERAQFLSQAVAAMRRAVDCGFDNHALLVGVGRDLRAVKDLPEFRALAAQVEQRAKIAQK